MLDVQSRSMLSWAQNLIAPALSALFNSMRAAFENNSTDQKH